MGQQSIHRRLPAGHGAQGIDDCRFAEQRSAEIEDAVVQGRQQVAPFEHKDDTPAGQFAGQVEEEARQGIVARQRKAGRGEGVLPVGVKADGDEDQVRAEGTAAGSTTSVKARR